MSAIRDRLSRRLPSLPTRRRQRVPPPRVVVRQESIRSTQVTRRQPRRQLLQSPHRRRRDPHRQPAQVAERTLVTGSTGLPSPWTRRHQRFPPRQAVERVESIRSTLATRRLPRRQPLQSPLQRRRDPHRQLAQVTDRIIITESTDLPSPPTCLPPCVPPPLAVEQPESIRSTPATRLPPRRQLPQCPLLRHRVPPRSRVASAE
jgi:hypothetical protein